MKINLTSQAIDFLDHQDGMSIALTLPLEQHIVGVFGPSGSGKSTLLQSIAGLLHIEANTAIEFAGQDWQSVDAVHRPFCLVSDKTPLFRHLTVAQNLRLISQHGAFNRASKLSQTAVIELCGIESLLDKSASLLSSGESQRVRFARALLSGKSVILLDEAFSALDWRARQHFIGLLPKLQQAHGLRFILVSHSLQEVAACCSYIVHIQQGKVIAADDSALMVPKLAMQNSTVNQLAVRHQQRLEDYRLEQWQLLDKTNAASSIAEAPMTNECLQIYTHLSDNAAEQHFIVLEGSKIVISLAESDVTSMVNQLPAVIQRIEPKQSYVLVTLLVAGQTLLAEISAMSQERMNLVEGQSVFAQFKVI